MGGDLSTALLRPEQAALLQEWLPGLEVRRDLSWGLVDTAVLEVGAGGRRYIVKAAGLADHHLAREITAHRTATGPLVAIDCAARMPFADAEAHVLVTDYLEGELVRGGAAEWMPATYARAGDLLRKFHGQASWVDDEIERTETDRALTWLEQPSRIRPDRAREARAILTAYRPPAVTVVPAHGDWHPRNWLVEGQVIKVIDFGRFAYRTAASDLCRLQAQQWRGRPDLEAAFLEGYGSDPRQPLVWRMLRLREAVSTAVWAYQVGDEPFESQGHRMLDDALGSFA